MGLGASVEGTFTALRTKRLVAELRLDVSPASGEHLGRRLTGGNMGIAGKGAARLNAHLSANKHINWLTPLLYSPNKNTGGQPLGALDNDTAAAGG